MLTSIYNQRITILNKLRKDDSVTGKDVWRCTVLDDAVWYPQTERAVITNGVQIGSFIKVFIPFHNNYKDYLEWKEPGNQDGNYTMSIGDYIILGELTEEEKLELASVAVTRIVSKYEPNVCQVKHVQPVSERFGATVQLKIEGV